MVQEMRLILNQHLYKINLCPLSRIFKIHKYDKDMRYYKIHSPDYNNSKITNLHTGRHFCKILCVQSRFSL